MTKNFNTLLYTIVWGGKMNNNRKNLVPIFSVCFLFLIWLSSSANAEPRAFDGQTLSSQKPEIQENFRNAFGEKAEEIWVKEHNREIGHPDATAVDNKSSDKPPVDLSRNIERLKKRVRKLLEKINKWLEAHRNSSGETGSKNPYDEDAVIVPPGQTSGEDSSGGSSSDADPSKSPPPPKVKEGSSRMIWGISPAESHQVSPTELQALKTLGIQTVRVNFQAGYPREDFDRVVETYKKNGIDVLMLVCYEAFNGEFREEKTPWNSIRKHYTNQLDMLDVLADLVPRYKEKGVNAWEIWNEEDGEWYLTPEEYASLLCRAYEKFKFTDKWDPGAKVVFGGLDAVAADDNGGNGAAAQYMRDFYKTRAYKAFKGKYGRSPFDVMAIHPYGANDEGKFHFNLNSIIGDVMKANGDGDKPIWLTELGDASENDKQQADAIENFVQSALSYPAVKRFYLFKYTYGGPTYHRQYSIVYPDGKIREGFHRYRKIIRENP